MGRLCQVKGELSRFGRDGVRADYLSLEEHLAKAGLPPSALELPIPRFFVEKNVHEVADSLLAEAKVAIAPQRSRARRLTLARRRSRLKKASRGPPLRTAAQCRRH